MSNIIELDDVARSELDVYVRLTGNQLRSSKESENGIFIAESPTVIEVALNSGCEPISLLTDKRLLMTDAVDKIISVLDAYGESTGIPVPIYTAEKEVLRNLTGFELTRGALCAMKRPTLPDPASLCKSAKRIAVFEEITDSTNIGALFRSAAALGVDAVLVTPTCCDPLCRRAVRVSMGTVFQVPFARLERWPDDIELIKSFGFKTLAMALSDDSVSLGDEALKLEDKLAIILGTEGTGLKKETIAAADYTVKIPMSHGVDSLNVGAAGAVAFWQLCANR